MRTTLVRNSDEKPQAAAACAPGVPGSTRARNGSPSRSVPTTASRAALNRAEPTPRRSSVEATSTCAHARVGWAGDCATAAAPTSTSSAASATTARLTGTSASARKSERAMWAAGFCGSPRIVLSLRSSPSTKGRMRIQSPSRAADPIILGPSTSTLSPGRCDQPRGVSHCLMQAHSDTVMT